jgi:hypothetical protein
MLAVAMRGVTAAGVKLPRTPRMAGIMASALPMASRAGDAAAASSIGAVRGMAGGKKKLKAMRKIKVSSAEPKRFKMQAKPDDPKFKDVFRKFMMLVHPDLFGKFPELQTTNQDSMQQLQEVLGLAKSGQHESELPVLRKTLVFYVRTETSDHYKRIPFELRTSGSNCKHVLGKAMSQLFDKCGLPATFHWGSEYWERTVFTKERRPEEDEE